ncbi:hypothetical protein GGR52DRAFT_558287 [Hypoxylon sp. FL1284]|nr:hypothetical protein GGR52DRAFT_558287 [Hypoxylon sp. FL1284]
MKDNAGRIKSESSDEQRSPFLSLTLPEATTGLKLQLWNTSLACEKLCRKIVDLGDEHETLKQEQHDRIAHLQEDVARQRQTINSLQAKINQQRANYSLLVGDMERVCDEKQRVVEQCDIEQFQKELNGLILDQYRDEAAEQNKKAEEKDMELRHLAGVIARPEAEVQNQCCYYERRIAVGERERSDLTRLLSYERDSAWHRRLAAASRGRKRGFRRGRRPVSMP